MKKILAIFILFLSANAYAQKLQVVNPKCELKVNPLGVENFSPRLSWELLSSNRNVNQTAYHILAADSREQLEKNIGNIWDSKKVNSNASVQVEYKGRPLEAAKTYYWKVRVWDNKKNVSEWSEPAVWQMGLGNDADWKNAQWIAYEKLADSLVDILPSSLKKDTYWGNNILPILRKDFSVNKPVKKASMFISGLGHFEMSLNGKKIGDHFLDAGWTKYDKEALYVTFDLTEELQQGKNAIGVMLGNGFYYIPPVKGRYRKQKVTFGYPKMICRLLIDYEDGTSDNIISDASWKTAAGPITFSSIYGGEDYDAGLEQPGWNKPGFDESAWKNVIIVDGPPKLRSQMAEPLKVMQVFEPQRISKVSGGEWVYDLGQNASGIIEIKVQGKKGDTVRITPAELLKTDGTVNQKPTGSPFYFQYILKGSGVETWRPRFTYYGFRYLQLKGGVPKSESGPSPGQYPVVLELNGLHTRNAAARAGSFTSSNELFNKTDELIQWAMKSNMASVFTDCPHREKLGWLEQTHLMGTSLQYNFDISSIGRKVIQDMRNSQTAEGLVPEIAPELVKFEWGGDMFRDSPEWGSASIILPWYLYKWYGDKQLVAEAYPMMRRYIDYLKTKAKGHILYQGLGDWYDLGPEPPGVSQLTPMGVTGTAIYYYNLNILQEIARLLGKPDDAAAYKALADEVKQAFNEKFFNPETKQYATGSQTANAMAIYMSLVEPQFKDAVLDNLIKDIRSRDNGLTAGDIGYRYVLRVLEAAGRSDVIFDMNSRSDVPGYGYQIAKGATALTESWAALPTVSNNHFMLGHLMEWFYSGLAGIRFADDAVAYNKIIIHPEPVGDVTSAKADHHSAYGLIVSDWKKRDNSFELNVQIPPGSSAVIYLPAAKESIVTEGGRLLKKVKDIKVSGYENGRLKINAGSGKYNFKVQQ